MKDHIDINYWIISNKENTLKDFLQQESQEKGIVTSFLGVSILGNAYVAVISQLTSKKSFSSLRDLCHQALLHAWQIDCPDLFVNRFELQMLLLQLHPL